MNKIKETQIDNRTEYENNRLSNSQIDKLREITIYYLIALA